MSIMVRNFFPTFVETLSLYGGLNQEMFRERLRFLLPVALLGGVVGGWGWDVSSILCKPCYVMLFVILHVPILGMGLWVCTIICPYSVQPLTFCPGWWVGGQKGVVLVFAFFSDFLSFPVP